MQRKLFCEINPTCYKISVQKEVMLRSIRDFFSGKKYAKSILPFELPYVIKSHSSILLRNLHGVDMKLQKNKITNIEIASNKINQLVIHPGEVFSFWNLVGNPTYKRGFKEGLVVTKQGLSSGPGGGLCQLANLIHYLVLNSPLEVVEKHHHGDALFPDDRRRVPFGTGTSVSYKMLDYQFRNNLKYDVQLLVWIEGDYLMGELRSQKECKYKYKLVEEDHHYKKEYDGRYFRNSKVYKLTISKKTNKELKKELVLNNHSLVLYDYSLIPKKEIRYDD